MPRRLLARLSRLTNREYLYSIFFSLINYLVIFSFFKSFVLHEDERISSQSSSHFHLQLRPPTIVMEKRSLQIAHARDTTITTRLPPELWFLILRYATYPPFPWSCTSSTDSPSSLDACDRHYDSHQNTTLPFHIRLANYSSQLHWKSSLTRVCKDWNVWSQQFLWEDLWIASAKDGKVLAGLISGKFHSRAEQGQAQALRTGREQIGSYPPLSADALITQRLDTRTDVDAGKEKHGFSLKRLRNRSVSKSSVITTHVHIHPHTPASFSPSRRKNIASYIKKLHIETPSLDRCCPSDLISILEKCERLEVFIDLRSVRSGFGFVDVGVGDRLHRNRTGVGKEKLPRDSERGMVGPGSIPQDHLFPQSRIPSSCDPILQTLLHPTTRTLKHLTFTNYKYDPDDFDGGVWFWEDVVSRALNGAQDASRASDLESLEVVMSTRGVGMDYGYGYVRRNRASTLLNRRFEPGLLTSLDLDVNHNPPLSLTLPSLHSLRIPLTSPTLLVIATWSLPSLQSLSLVSIDFTGWRRMGFKKFMEVHGGGLISFEIVGGGESGEEEGWITERVNGIGHPTSSVQRQQNLHLPSTSPLLKHFICSTNASEWNWETPDWIAPHVLMPEHFGVERIGVWGLEDKLVGGDYDGMGNTLRIGRRRRTWTSSSRSRPSSHDDDEDRLLVERPFFMLQEQFGSLLRREAFPSLVCIRDMSWESDLIRRSVGIGCFSEPESSTVDPATPTSSAKRKQKGFKSLKETVASRFTRPIFSSAASSSIPSPPVSEPQPQMQFEPHSQSYKIRKFWLGVLERCNRRGVYIEDWMGRRVVA